MSDMPLRVALQQTLTGLAAQIPTTDPGYTEGLCGDDTRYEHLHWMISHCLTHLMEWPTDKISRWIGYVQGVATMRGIMDTTAERDRTRPIFHKAYVAMGLKKPITADRAPDDLSGHQIIDNLSQP